MISFFYLGYVTFKYSVFDDIIEGGNMKNKWLVKTLALVITVLFVVTVLSPIVFCNNAIVDEKEILLENYSDNRYFYPDYYNCYNASEIIGNSLIPDFKYNNFIYNETEYVNILKETSKPLDGPMDSAWPMFNHDVHHTGRSPYSTINVTGLEKWRSVNIQQGWGSVEGGPIIDKDGIIYYGDMDHYLYALYPNGTRKWATKLDDNIRCTPAIDENGILYI